MLKLIIFSGKLVTRIDKLNKDSTQPSSPKVPVLNIKPLLPPKDQVSSPKKDNFSEASAPPANHKVPILHIKPPKPPPSLSSEPEQPMLGQFVTKKDAPNSKGQAIHDKRTKSSPAIPKLVIKKPVENVEKAKDSPKLMPCRVNLQNLTMKDIGMQYYTLTF